ncbi:MAG: hypothetical protein WAT79_08245 [Saprospiraceae bacterium]
MSNQNTPIEIKFDSNGKSLDIRTGSLSNLPVPKKGSIDGCITAPADFYNAKYFKQKGGEGLLYPSTGMLLSYSKKDASITYSENVYDDGGGMVVTGKLKLDSDLSSLNINENHVYTNKELSDKLKMLSVLFEDRSGWSKIVSSLKNFHADVTKKLEEADDDKGNKTMNYVQTLKTSFDLDFVLNCNIFTGVEMKKSFKVEINADVRSKAVDLWLESVELKEIIDQAVDQVLAE